MLTTLLDVETFGDPSSPALDSTCKLTCPWLAACLPCSADAQGSGGVTSRRVMLCETLLSCGPVNLRQQQQQQLMGMHAQRLP